MSWTFAVAAGTVYRPDGSVLTNTAYAGHGVGVNNPDEEYTSMIGPLPHGSYIIGGDFTHPRAGPMTMRLTPTTDTVMENRDGFLIHGDLPNKLRVASNGCIVLSREYRLEIANSVDRSLVVTHG